MIRRAVAVAFLSFAVTMSGAVRHRAVQPPEVNGPRAVADSYSVARGQTLTVTAAKGVLANDTAPAGKTLIAAVAAKPSHGTLTLNSDGGFTYANDGSAATVDTFTYTANDGTITSVPATVTIAITGTAPNAVSDTYSTTQGQTLAIAAPGLLANDTLNGATIRSYGASGTEQTGSGKIALTAQGGAVNVQADGSFSYSPNGGFSGTDSFRYVIANDAGSSTATVTITVSSAAPVATGDSFSASGGTALTVQAPGVLANDTLNGASIASYGVTGAEQTSVGSATATSQGGSVILSANGGFTYNPAANFSGNDTFNYTLRNAGGSSTATVTITVQSQVSTPTTLTVTSPGFFFAFSGIQGQNPTLTLKRGVTYTFEVNTSAIHPFEITGAPAGSVTNNNISSGTITFVVPAADANYGYVCPIHGFGGTIVTVP